MMPNTEERAAGRAERRQRLALAIGKMALAIDAGRCTPTLAELEALAAICTEHQLPAESARVRRWFEGA